MSTVSASCILDEMLAAWTLCEREVVRFLRQRARVLAAIGTPLLFWAVLGSGLGRSFRVDNGGASDGYLRYFFPGAILMTVLFTAIFSAISLIEDRREGFMQGVLVAPVSRFAIVLGKVLGGTLVATAQGALMLALAPFCGFRPSLGGAALAVGAILLTAFAMTCVGVAFAWRIASVQGFHAVMNLVLFPMWLLSGALFPASGASGWIRSLMAIDPATYYLVLLRAGLGDSAPFDPALSAGIGIVFAGAAYLTAWRMACRTKQIPQ
ncbi:MAG: multidrug ABC transporter permease [Candidatus Hydrogenedentota bacterium]|jgi:ABC-2 type transport system permease protein|nr:MAG: multidrug ABC transporter permease [Candidatus Hydrogenedentota bacterium]GIX43820.1 MAG: transport permease protein [Candidatus Sumerlaea sp.]